MAEFSVFQGSGRSQLLGIPLQQGAPQDYRAQIGPRLGVAYAPGNSGRTAIRAGFGMFYDDLAQRGWATAFQAVNRPVGPCSFVNVPGCYALLGCGYITGGSGASGNLIVSNYKTPYNIHATAGVERIFSVP